MMTIGDSPTYYDILDLRPDASPQEVREAYLRTKSTYNKDSVALYTLVSTEEREEMLRRVEQAYEVLSSVEKRREYDAHHGILENEEPPVLTSRPPANKKIVSIDRVPPMDTGMDSEDLLIAPATDFTSNQSTQRDMFSSSDAPLPSSSTSSSTQPPMHAPPSHSSASGSASASGAQPESRSGEHVEVSTQTEWPGVVIRKVREQKRVSIEEMAAVTKITKNYIVAIEEENFAKLPAAVYLRGFIIQIAKVLKLPHEKVAGGYMARYYQARPDQSH